MGQFSVEIYAHPGSLLSANLQSDVQDALTVALQAFHLPETFVETEGGRWQ